MTAQEILAQVPIFADLSEPDLRSIAESARRRVFQPGDTILYAGDPGTTVCFLGSGKVKVHCPGEDGEEMILGVLSAGDFFGELSVLDDEPRSADVTCIDTAEVAVIGREDFLDCLDRHPPISRRILQAQSARLRETDRHLQNVASLDVFGRVASQLLDLAERHPVETPEGVAIGIKLSQGDLAGMIGSSRESVNRVLSNYRGKGWVKIDRGRFTLLDVEALSRKAGRG